MSASIDDEAALWAVRLEAGPLSNAQRAALDAWLAVDEKRHGALLRAEAALAYVDRARALGPQNLDQAVLQHEREEEADWDEEPTPASGLGRRTFLSGIAAAGVAVIGWTAFQAFDGPRTAGGPQAEIATVVGEIRRMPLADGSTAAINTSSRLAVDIRPDRRIVRLQEGEAWFQVARDVERPFIVEAGAVRVQAVGTAFSVRRREGGAEVLVTEGVVTAWIEGRETERRRIEAGARGFLSAEMPRVEVAAAPDEVERALAWRDGELALNGETLSQAAAEMNRYNRRQLVIADPALGREQIVGYFETNEPETFARAAAELVGARVVIESDEIRLLPAGP